MLEIGIAGLPFRSGNKGCEALSYSFLHLLDQAARAHEKRVRVWQLTPFPTRKWIKSGLDLARVRAGYAPAVCPDSVETDCLFYLPAGGKILFPGKLNRLKAVFDFTAGDSFTDLYGKERFYARTLVKRAVEKKGVPLILGSQTIGPFRDDQARGLAARVIRDAAAVYARDGESQRYAEEISGRRPQLTSDIAFALPFEKPGKRTGARVGFNPSGLLWNGGYSRDNQFSLKADYRAYCRQVIGALKDKYEVHLIPHAFSDNMESADNDLAAVEALHREFPQTVAHPGLPTPMAVKTLIAGMDVMLAARMHAAIGAFSAGVPVIPFSYSRKFEGLFESLDYPYVIHGAGEDTDQAVRRTLDMVENREKLAEDMARGHAKTDESTAFILGELGRLLFY